MVDRGKIWAPIICFGYSACLCHTLFEKYWCQAAVETCQRLHHSHDRWDMRHQRNDMQLPSILRLWRTRGRWGLQIWVIWIWGWWPRNTFYCWGWVSRLLNGAIAYLLNLGHTYSRWRLTSNFICLNHPIIAVLRLQPFNLLFGIDMNRWREKAFLDLLPSFLASYPTSDSISLFETIFDQ